MIYNFEYIKDIKLLEFLEDCKSLSLEKTIEYLTLNPTDASEGSETIEKQTQNINNFYEKAHNIIPKQQTTKPDDLVSIVLELVYKHKKSERTLIQNQYNQQKQSEMMIGQLLELYILIEGKDVGWAFTAQCISGVDFIKNDSSNWIPLQIKNSDNTENSSAKKIRDGTKIKKWFRRFSSPRIITPQLKIDENLSQRGFYPNYMEEFHRRKNLADKEEMLRPFQTNQFNWDRFPDEKLKSKLSEDKFRKFVEDYFISII